jgi:hypothetical protein
MAGFKFISSPLIAWLNEERSTRAYALSDFERISYELKPCDILLVEGRSRVSDVIRWLTQSAWTHAALYIGRIHDIENPELREIVEHHYVGDPGDRLVIESLLGRGTIVRNLAVYEDAHLRICRPSRLGLKDSHQVIRYAISRLGVDYDVRQIFDLARFLLPWYILPRKWASTLFERNVGRSTKTVCSTMIAEAFAFVQFPILPLIKESDEGVQLFRRNPRLCTPSDFDYSPYFEIIKYPFVDFRHDEDYHLLPWDGRNDLSEEENKMYFGPENGPSESFVDEAIEEALRSSRQAPLEGEFIAAADGGPADACDASTDSNDDDAGQNEDPDQNDVPPSGEASPGSTESKPGQAP